MTSEERMDTDGTEEETEKEETNSSTQNSRFVHYYIFLVIGQGKSVSNFM